MIHRPTGHGSSILEMLQPVALGSTDPNTNLLTLVAPHCYPNYLHSILALYNIHHNHNTPCHPTNNQGSD